MHICVVAEGYPFAHRAYFTFVKQLCVAMADLGIRVSVIVPQSITKSIVRKVPIAPKYRREKTAKGNYVDIYSPRIISLGQLGTKGGFKHFNSFWFSRSVCKVVEKFENKPDVLYGHFWHSAYAVYPVAKKYKIPLFVASGEAEIELHHNYSHEHLREFIAYIKGVICVSTKNKNESVNARLATMDKCIVIPNAIDVSLFHKKDKDKLRDQFGISPTDFVVAFVGGFIYRKGANRVAMAIQQLDDPSIKSIFIGKLMGQNSTDLPECNGIIFRGPLSHDKVADYLNCADVFVMPTLHEGCCNANIEALACGLPIISSDRDFNYDILDSSCAILVDPMDVNDIANAILYLKTHLLERQRMSDNAFEKSKSYHITTRVKLIVNYISSCL